jgi:hypothetical protein
MTRIAAALKCSGESAVRPRRVLRMTAQPHDRMTA